MGNAGVDLSMSVPRLPHPGETLVATALTRAPGGKGLNQAVAASRAGASVQFLAPAGTDADAAALCAILAAELGRAAFTLVPIAAATDLSIIFVDPAGENSIVTSGACADALAPDVAAGFGAAVQPGDMFCVQGNLSLAATLAGVDAARANGAKILFNAAPLRWHAAPLLGRYEVLVANHGEAAAITGLTDPAIAASVLHQGGAEVAIVTLGAAGCVWADAAGRHSCPAAPATVVDTTGAGDTFCGVLAAALAKGCELGAAIAAAARAAAITVSRPGAFAALPTREGLSWFSR